MKKILAGFMILILVFSMSVPAQVHGQVTFREASVVEYEGTVKISIAGGQKKYDPYKGMSLSQGDTIETSGDSWISLYIDDDKEIKLAENSRLTLSELSKYIDSQSEATGLRLWVGKIWVNIKKKLNIRSKFEVQAGSTVMGVKGTQFFAGQSNGITDIGVLHGTVVATGYIPVEGDNGEAEEQEIALEIGQNQMLQLNSGPLTQEPPQVEELQPESLDLFLLEAIQQNPEGVDQQLLGQLDQLIEQQQQQQQQQEQQQEQGDNGQNNGQEEQQQIYYDEVVLATPTPVLRPTMVPPAPTAVPTPSTVPTPSVEPTPSAEPTPSTAPDPTPPVTPEVDTQAPYVVDGAIQSQLGISGTGNDKFTIRFSELLSDTSKSDLESIISNSVIDDYTADLDFHWGNDMNNYYKLTVSNLSDIYGIRFNDTADINAEISDEIGNSGTVSLLEIAPVTVVASPDAALLTEVDSEYSSGTKVFDITLPQGSAFKQGLIEYDASEYITLGGVLTGIPVVRLVNDEMKINVAHLTIYSNDFEATYQVDNPGVGTITLSQALWGIPLPNESFLESTSPLRAEISFATTVITVDSYVLGQATLNWTPYGDNAGETITVMMSEISKDVGFTEVTPSSFNLDNGTAVIDDLTTGKAYWFRLSITGGMREGQSNTVGIIMPESELQMPDITNILLDYPEPYQVFSIDLQNQDVSVEIENPDIVDFFLDMIQNELIIDGIGYGSSQVTLTIRKAGYTTVIIQFEVTVNYVSGGC